MVLEVAGKRSWSSPFYFRSVREKYPHSFSGNADLVLGFDHQGSLELCRKSPDEFLALSY
jgi:hypothetical protein